MKAMVLNEISDLNQNPNPLTLEDVPTPKPGNNELLIRVITCGVCHTELDEIEGRTPPPYLPVILGHQVGGVGLNITAANHVIHYTRPWNPAKENQATDRVHRIGQTRSVNVYYPVVKNDDFATVEQVLNELIQSKEALAKDVLRPSSELKVKGEDLFKCLDVDD